MREHHVGSLVVVSDGAAAQPLGIVTDRDLVVEVLSADIDYRTVSVGEIIAEELGDIVQAIGRERSSEAARRH
jgi:CBS domain-containing protein